MELWRPRGLEKETINTLHIDKCQNRATMFYKNRGEKIGQDNKGFIKNDIQIGSGFHIIIQINFEQAHYIPIY